MALISVRFSDEMFVPEYLFDLVGWGWGAKTTTKALKN